jgi:hypothetical protein
MLAVSKSLSVSSPLLSKVSSLPMDSPFALLSSSFCSKDGDGARCSVLVDDNAALSPIGMVPEDHASFTSSVASEDPDLTLFSLSEVLKD